MPKMLVNLTFVAVNHEITQFLLDYRDFDAIGMTETELRVKLMTFILARCKDRFKWVETNDKFSYSADLPPAPLEQRLEIEALIQTAMDIFRQEQFHQRFHSDEQSTTKLNAECGDESDASS